MQLLQQHLSTHPAHAPRVQQSLHQQQLSSTSACTAVCLSAQVVLLTNSLACTRESAASPWESWCSEPRSACPGRRLRAPSKGLGPTSPELLRTTSAPAGGRACHAPAAGEGPISGQAGSWVALPLVRLASTLKLLHRHCSLQGSQDLAHKQASRGGPSPELAAKNASSSLRPASASDTCKSHRCHGPPSRRKWPSLSKPGPKQPFPAQSKPAKAAKGAPLRPRLPLRSAARTSGVGLRREPPLLALGCCMGPAGPLCCLAVCGDAVLVAAAAARAAGPA